MSHELEALSQRVAKLERRNRFLTLLLLLAPILAIGGWQASPVPDLLRVRRLEVVDERGVPMVILGTGRKGEGGSVTLRDALGEKRGWWQVEPAGSNLTMSADSGTENASTAGFGVTPRSSRLSLISPKGASVSASIEAETPRIDVYSTEGKVLFGAPWKAAK